MREKKYWIEVLIAVDMKSSVFWDITLCGLLKVNRLFGGRCRLHPQGRSLRARGQRESRWQTVFMIGLYFGPEDEGDMFLETSVDFEQTTPRYIPEDRTLLNTGNSQGDGLIK
jgi:hypothetical protein